MMIPVRYWLLMPGDFASADVFNSSNWLFWHPGPDRDSPDAAPKGWAPHVKDLAKSYTLVPHAALRYIQGSGVGVFLQRRALQLPRQGGFFLVWVKTMVRRPHYAFSLGLAHYRHCGASSPFEEFILQEELPGEIKRWFPDGLEVGD